MGAGSNAPDSNLTSGTKTGGRSDEELAMIIIGEKINGTRKDVAEAIEKRIEEKIARLATDQVSAGADYLDVNAGTPPEREPEDMVWLVKTIQQHIQVPLCLDSANPAALKAGIKATRKRPILNSLSGENERIEGVLPLSKEYDTELVILALDDDGIPESTEKRVDIVKRLIEKTRAAGIPDERLYVDPLVTTIATDNRSGTVAMETIRRIREEFPGVHVTCGLSNISYGQPARSVINQAFTPLAIAAGLDCAILDPLDVDLSGMILATELVLGRDLDCRNYIEAHRAGQIRSYREGQGSTDRAVAEAFRKLERTLERTGILKEDGAGTWGEIVTDSGSTTGPVGTEDLIDALVQMEKDRVQTLVGTLLEIRIDPMDILAASRQAMVEVGNRFEKGTYFIPELILAGRMLKEVAERVEPLIRKGTSTVESRGRVLIGTVEGDIHDIGKDIVVTLLEVNGYEVKDLGVDVPVARFVEAVKEFKPRVVGLSGFLTLAYDPMKETIAMIREETIGDMKFMLGGGQIDEQVRVYTEADAFGKDAIEAVNLCDHWIDRQKD